MSKQTRAISDDLGQLTEDTRALLATTADGAQEKVRETHDRVVAAVENGKAMCGRARRTAAGGVRFADSALRKHPYPALGIAFGVGALFGDLIAHHFGRSGD